MPSSNSKRPASWLKPLFIMAFLGLALVPFLPAASDNGLLFKILVPAVAVVAGVVFYYFLWVRDPEKDIKEMPRWVQFLGFFLV